MHLVYAGLGATAATVVCVVIMLGMMRFATDERPDSLAAIITCWRRRSNASPGNDLADASGCRARWAERFQRANESAEQDAVFTLDAVVTRDGRLAEPRGARATARHARRSTRRELIEDAARRGVAGAVRRRRGCELPSSAANMVWLVEHTTVRATRTAAASTSPLPREEARRVDRPQRVQPVRA